MSYRSTHDLGFLATARRWIVDEGEILAMVRYHAAAGSKEFVLLASAEELEGMLAGLPARTCVVVFRDRQVPIRGRVDPALIDAAVASIDDATEWLVTDLRKTVMGKQSWRYSAAGVGRETLRAELEEKIGDEVAVGPYPPWLEDSAVVMSAVVPEPDGRVLTGVY